MKQEHEMTPGVLVSGEVLSAGDARARVAVLEAELADYERLQAETERLQAECALLRAAIRRLCNIYVVDDYYDGQLREDRLEAAVNRAIDAALAQQGKDCQHKIEVTNEPI